MPAYSFKERFVPWVKDGSKPGTVRAFRKYPVKVGQLAHLFYGMRTKYCSKLVEPSPEIKQVYVIYISKDQEVALIDMNWMNPGIVKMIELFGKEEVNKFPSVKWLDCHERDQLAWQDGFRFGGRSVSGCFDLMIRFWRQTHELPFIGNYILWGDSKIVFKP